LNYEFPPLGGGAGNATFYLLKEFARFDDLRVTLITSSVGEYRYERFSDNIDIYFLDIGKNNELYNQSNKDLLLYSWKAFWQAWKLKKKERFDLVHAFFGVPCGFIAMMLNIPYIVSLRGADVPGKNPKYKYLYIFLKGIIKKVWMNAECVIANSEDLKNVALKTKKDLDIKVIPNGVDCDKFSVKKRDDDVFRILYVGRFLKNKGIIYLLDAFEKFSKDKDRVELFLVGDGPLFGEFKNGYGDKKNIKFFGKTDQSKLIDIYHESDVFVLPSFGEGMSNALLEAMACGLAVIATATGGVKYLLGENEFIVDFESSEDIFLKLEKLYLDKKLLSDLKNKNREIAERLSWGVVALEYEKIYDKLK